MKCPKCAYVGFEVTDRCRHCGYEFSLMPAPAAAAMTGSGASTATAIEEDLRLTSPVPSDAMDLPLGTTETRTPSMFIEQPPPARTPLAVRRTTSDRARHRAGPQLVRPRLILAEIDATPEPPDTPPAASAPGPAGLVPRGVAALLDGVFLMGIDLAVIYLTVRMAGLGLAEAAALPPVPLGAFVGGLDLAYLVVCTRHGGQTFGKMALGLRVEGLDVRSVTLPVAVLRVAVSVLGLAALGLGWLVAALRDDRRALHDHAAQTRVVKVAP